MSGPAGQPLGDLQIFCRLEGFATRPVKVQGNCLELHGCDPSRSMRVMVLDAQHQWGVTVEFSQRNAGDRKVIGRQE